jgi:hypothetical protein
MLLNSKDWEGRRIEISYLLKEKPIIKEHLQLWKKQTIGEPSWSGRRILNYKVIIETHRGKRKMMSDLRLNGNSPSYNQDTILFAKMI